MKISNIFFLIGALVFLFSSCVDDDLDLNKSDDIPDGETEINASLSFTSFFPALERSRAAGGTPGTAISDIESLYLLIYEDTGEEVTNEDGTKTKLWKLEEGGRIQLNTTEHSLKIENPGPDRTDKDKQVETETAYATFRLRHKTGTYKIYAVANVDLSPEKVADEDIDTPEKLKGYSLRWYTGAENVAKNNGMFGYFTNNDAQNSPETVDIAPNQQMHAWIYRAASKVTISYDGSKLADDVEIYILAANIRDIPVRCSLGSPNEPDAENLLIADGGSIVYYKNDVNNPNPNELTLEGYEACVTNKKTTYGSDHTVSADALYFYENMQGEGKPKEQTAPGPGNGNGSQGNTIGFPTPDKETPGSGWKDEKPYGTYIEVDAYYRSKNSANLGSGIIKYRFMLGKDTHTNYDAERNHHYKLTLNFKGYANDYDWHIDYKKNEVFEVSNPKVYNYMGKVFMPDYYWPNGMHNFVPENPITVTSYVGNENDPQIKFSPVEVSVEYDDPDSPWLKWTEVQGPVPYQKNFVFTVDKEKLKVDGKYVKEFNINSLLAAESEKGKEENPINLADLERRPINSNAKITCTANCYMVDAPGWYILPLVYGNAVHNGKVIESSYKPSPGLTDDEILPVFKNCNNKDISSAYIETDLNIRGKDVYPFLVWQDVDNLVDYIYWEAPNTRIIYVPNAFYDVDNKKTIGGVKFHVTKGQQGNSVIAIGGESPNNKVLLNLPDAYWSWHIWVTCLDKQLDDADKTITVQGYDPQRHFDFMPVNLGWCSGENEDIIYYKERRCTVKFTFKGN